MPKAKTPKVVMGYTTEKFDPDGYTIALYPTLEALRSDCAAEDGDPVYVYQLVKKGKLKIDKASVE